jgi:2-amino-4-hydroxy-6-hydroxymethyldihydropteridine diphosphokinase
MTLLPRVEAGFSLGSNLGDRLSILRAARDALVAVPGVRLAAQSPVYETEPVGVKDEHRALKYLNAVVVVASPLNAHAWLAALSRIEASLGRVRGPDRYAPRTIDIDLLYCGDAWIESGGLTVPHPRWAQRRFVVQPLADIRPALRLPGTPGTVAGILATLEEPASDLRVVTAEW